MREEELISVIVPFYNMQDYLSECIESIINQTYKNLQIILVDDGSTDNSLNICKVYKDKDNRIEIIFTKHMGVNNARKEGAKALKGDYVLCVDADDWIDTDAIERLLDISPKSDIYTFCYFEEGNGYKKIKKNTYKEGYLTFDTDLMDFYNKMLMDCDRFEQGVLSSLCNKMIKRELFQTIQNQVPNEIYYGEDTACSFLCFLSASSVHITNMPIYHYRIRDNSCVRSAKIDKNNFRVLYRFLNQQFKNYDIRYSLKRQLSLYVWQSLLLKGYECIDNNMVLFPFEKVKSNMKLAIYGAGLFGQVIEQYCRINKCVEVSCWFDQMYAIYVEQGLNVLSSEEVINSEFDIMIIAILNEELARRIKEYYVAQGISEDKIDYVKVEVLEKNALPLFITEGV